VVEVIDTSNGTVANSISLPHGAAPGDIAVNSGGTLAVVVEHGQSAVAFLNLQTFKLLGQANVGHGPVAVTIVGNHAFVVNQDSDSVTVIDLESFVALSTIAVGHAPSSISVDMSRNRVLVTNSGSGTISAIDLTSLQVTSTVPLSLSSRPLSIRVVSTDDLAVITDASLKPGQVMVVDLLSNTSQIISVSGTQMGSWNVAAVLGAKAFLTDPVDGEVGIVTFSRDASKQIAFQTQVLNVQPGVETLDVDPTQNILIIIQSNGQVLLYNLTTNTTVANVDIPS
jgi:YVTN family beta-propeller protein